MPSKHIKLEILLVSVIVFVLMTDYTLLIGHPSTRVGMISHRLRNYLSSHKQTKNETGRRLETTNYFLRHDGPNKPVKITNTPRLKWN